ncbi:type IV toxin-antitoxin system AbiEi family antitoxin domain-containing protein [Sphingobacterium endophyticum]|uniref:type IV toxin-antitoxin system AbiEi family antitoxin domain-containing protein n=1 Tax=Sphingobacterium endophyticum TaxID=2546448 RepID=UPI0012E2D61D|nr:hypothetical protein [Sphingobacterium endophyticum]
MGRPSQLTQFYNLFVNFFNKETKRSYTEKKIKQLLDALIFRTDGLTKRSVEIINFLERRGELIESMIYYNNPERTLFSRVYSWKTSNDFTVMSGIKYNSYYSHYTAMSIHNLTLQLPKTIYLNFEKSNPYETRGENKEKRLELKQDSIDKAFINPQRKTSLELIYKDLNVILINGKFTDRLGVLMESQEDRLFYYTNLERTLIDIAVRPDYSGGVFEVLEAYLKAKNKCNSEKLAKYLSELNYIYPYHQVIGFYMQKAGYPQSMYKLFKKNIQYKFYLTYNMRRKAFSEEWQLFYPLGM